MTIIRSAYVGTSKLRRDIAKTALTSHSIPYLLLLVLPKLNHPPSVRSVNSFTFTLGILLSILLNTWCPISLTAQNSSSMTSWSYPYPTDNIVVQDSVGIAYIDQGEGPILLFIHGLGSNLKAWTKNIDSLKRHYRCIALDLPGYGRSPNGDYPYDMTFFADAVADFITTLELEEVHLIGHSMGGQIATHLSLTHPRLFTRMTLIAPAGFETFTAAEIAWFEQIYTPELLLNLPEAQIIRNFEINFMQMPADARFMIDDRMALRANLDAYRAYCRMIPKCVLGMLREPVLDNLSHIKLPTLVIYGEEDRLIPNKMLHPTLTVKSVANNGQSRMNNSTLKIIPECGHFVQWEGAQDVNQAIIAFQEQKESTSN